MKQLNIMIKTQRHSKLNSFLFNALIATLLVAGAWSPVWACSSAPPQPPPIIIEPIPSPIDLPKVRVIVQNYTTFGAAPNENCACGLNVPLTLGTVESVQVFYAGTDVPVPGWEFSPFENDTSNEPYDPGFEPGNFWQNFSSAVSEEIPPNLPIDFVFVVCATNSNNSAQFGLNMEVYLENAEVTVGTAGADPNGVPSEHIEVVPAGEVNQASDEQKKKEYERCLKLCEDEPSPLMRFMWRNHCRGNYEDAKKRCPKKHVKVGQLDNHRFSALYAFPGEPINLIAGVFQHQDIVVDGADPSNGAPPFFHIAPFPDLLPNNTFEDLNWQPLGPGEWDPNGFAHLQLQLGDMFPPDLTTFVLRVDYQDQLYGLLQDYNTLDILPEPPFIFKELLHSPMGQAELSLNEDEHLVVSNIGSSGEDGVAVILNEYQAFKADWAFPGPMALDMSVHVNSYAPTAEAGTFPYVNSTIQSSSDGFQYFVQFNDAILDVVLPYSIRLYHNSRLIREVDETTNHLVTTLSRLPDAMATRAIKHRGMLSYFFDGNPASITLTDGTVHDITELRLVSHIPTEMLGLRGTEILAAGIPQFLITCERALRLRHCVDTALDPAIPIPTDDHPVADHLSDAVIDPVLPMPLMDVRVVPPLMLDPTDTPVCGLDYYVWISQHHDYHLEFEQAAPYYVHYTLQDGSTYSTVYAVDLQPETTCGTGGDRGKEISCGNPDLVIISSKLGFPHNWPDDVDVEEAEDIADAVTAICTAVEANGGNPICVTIQAHGSPGSVEVGCEELDASNVCDLDDLKGKIKNLTFFSCSVGKGESGENFLCEVERKLCADVIGYDGPMWDTPPGEDQKWFTTGDPISWETDTVCAEITILLDVVYDHNTDLMNVLPNPNDFPTVEPFSDYGFAITDVAAEDVVMDDAASNQVGDIAIVDWVLVDVRDAVNPHILLDRKPGLVARNGRIYSPHGKPYLKFPHLGIGIENHPEEVHVVVHHRNHLRAKTPHPVPIENGFLIVNFRMMHPHPNHDGSIDVQPVDPNNPFTLTPGDINHDGVIDASDRSSAWNFRNAVGYLPWDINLDGVVNDADRDLIWHNRNKRSRLDD